MSGFNYEKDANGVVTVTMDMDGPVNSMSEAFLPRCVRRSRSSRRKVT